VFLQSPASYVALADLKADTTLDLTDRNGNLIPDSVLSEFLEDESGNIDALIGQSFLPQEEKLRFFGAGNNFLTLSRSPIIYIKQVKIVLPNSVGFDVPVQSLLVDFQMGTLQNMTPLTFQGVGITTIFPKDLPIDVTMAWGRGYAVPPPSFTCTPQGAQGIGTIPLAAGSHTVQLSSVTYSGESPPSAPQTVTLAEPGAISILVTNMPGAERFYVYVDGIFAAETQAYAIGAGTIGALVDATPSTDVVAYDPYGIPKTPQTTDTSAAPFQGKYAGLRKACKLLVQQRIWESKNLSNMGIARQVSGPKSVMWKDNMNSILTKQLDDLIAAFSYQAIG
jgi:hypothetical protein